MMAVERCFDMECEEREVEMDVDHGGETRDAVWPGLRYTS